MRSFIDESKRGLLPVSVSIFVWWLGRVGDRHILEEPVTCISRVDGGNMFLGKVGAYPQAHMVASQKRRCFFANLPPVTYPGLWPYFQLRESSLGRSLFRMIGQRPICVWMWVRFWWAVVWMFQMICGTTVLSLNLPPLPFFFWSFVKYVYVVVFWVLTQCSLRTLDLECLGLTGSV